MTEQEWLTCADPQEMLDALRGKLSDRKLRLFAVACCRRVVDLKTTPADRAAMDAVEKMAEGRLTVKTMRSACDAIFIRGLVEHQLPWFYAGSKAARDAAGEAAEAAAHRRGQRAFDRALAREGEHLADTIQDEAIQEEQTAQAHLLRCVAGPWPVQRVTDAKRWASANARSLAQSIYAENAFERMAILGDALEDAGCDYQDILNHCREPGEHCRGCWVLDLVLGKE